MGVSLLHFTQVFPLHEDTANFISKARKAAVVENNYTSQFARLIRMETGIDICWKILKYNGLPFTVEELADEIKKLVQE